MSRQRPPWRIATRIVNERSIEPRSLIELKAAIVARQHGFQRELTAAARDQWLNGLADISAFQERYVDSERVGFRQSILE